MAVGISSNTASPQVARERAELILAQLDRLPALPSALARLLAVTSDDDASVRELVRVIEPDPSLTACVLRVVHRSDMGAPRQGITISKAVALLGFRVVRDAALSSQLYAAFSPESGGDASSNARRKELWRHCLAAGCAAELIAERTNLEPRGHAFVCGLLHDIGKIALDTCFPKSYARVWERAERELGCVCDAEEQILGLDHTAAGRRLALRWRLDDAIVDAIWLHHQPPELLPSTVSHGALVAIVHLADALVRRAGIGASGSRHVVDLERTAAAFGLRGPALEEIVAAVPERMRPLCEAIGLDDVDDPAARLASLTQLNDELSRQITRLNECHRGFEQRSSFQQAAAEVYSRVAEEDRAADVCAVAADVVRSLFHADDAMVFVADRVAKLLHVGVSEPAPRSLRATVIEWPDVEELLGGGVAGQVAPAGGAHESVFLRSTGAPPPGPLWLIPLRTQTVAGGILFAAPERDVRPYLRGSDDVRSLCQAVTFAAGSALARGGVDRMAQELLDVNRRLHMAQADLARQRSLAMIAEMAGGAAHELNNPLAVISGRSQMALSQCQDAELRRTLEIIHGQTQRASGIVAELMNFAKPSQPTPALLPLHQTLKTVCQRWQARSEVGNTCPRLESIDATATLYCDPAQFAEMLEAVLDNALQATGPTTRSIQVNSLAGASDETVRLRVSDNGTGMTPDVLEHALDPFFSSRLAGRGRGLGLSRAYRLAEINGGRLWLESTPQVGTTVHIELPARAPKA